MVISVLFIVIRNDTIIYDPYSRNPVYASADRSVAAELLLLAKHYHPSIAIFASNLMAVILLHNLIYILLSVYRKTCHLKLA